MELLTNFQALCIKTFLLTKREHAQTAIEIALAYTSLGLFLGIRYILERYQREVSQIPPFLPQDPMQFDVASTNIVYYYPCELFIFALYFITN